MTPESLRLLTGFFDRLFLLAAMFAVLWVKGYLWWIFGAALGLYLASVLAVPTARELVQGARAPARDLDDEDDLPPAPPTKPFRALFD